MDTLATISLQASKLAASQSVVASPTLLNMMATLKSSPDLVTWLEADTCYQTSGGFMGWRDRISGQLFVPYSGAMATLENDALFNNAPTLDFSTAAKAMYDNGANLFPNSNSDFSIVVVGLGTTGQNLEFVTDAQPLATATWLQQNSSGQITFNVDGQSMFNSTSVGYSAAWLAIASFKYGAAGASSAIMRVNSGAQTLTKSSGITGAPAGAILEIGSYNGNNSTPGSLKMALAMVYKAAILHGSYASQTYANWSNELYYQILESYCQTKYGVP